MKILRFIALCTLISILNNTDVCATHNRSGEITYKQTGPLTILATITTYTKASSTSADRDSLTLNWGDGESEIVARSNGNGEIILGEDIKVNYYTAEHTYPGRATFTLSFEDPNRVDNIVNVNFPNSVDVPFFVSTTFTLINTQFQGFNNSVVLLQPPIDFACANQKFIHNPNAYDVDGDSLSYELVIPLQAEGDVVPSYRFPDEVSAGPENRISLDPITGDFVWDSPKQTGEYNIAIKINEYRNGILLNSVIRDMQIRVESCISLPPSINVIDEICVVAGEKIEIPVSATDPDTFNKIRITATGGPFLVDFSRAVLSGDNEFRESPLTKFFVWQTECEHISNNFYQVVFKAQDNSINNNTGLTVLKTLKIKVVGPAPENLEAEVNFDRINLSWDLPYSCENAFDNYFIGFSVWRKINTRLLEIDTCTPGLEGQGYSIVKFNTQDNDGSKYTYSDSNVEKGKIYCYRVLANFAKQTTSGNPFNIVESLSSDEICTQLQQDFPLITEASVINTDLNNGDIQVRWLKPKKEDFDTIANPGPYRYTLLRSVNGNTFQEIPGANFTSNNFSDAVAQSFLDNSLNTNDIQFYYRVDFYSNGNFYSSSPTTSSVYLNIRSSDNINSLSWDESTSWENHQYNIYRKDLINPNFELISTVNTRTYLDRNVMNEINYCYRIESIGTYGISGTPEIIKNFSQENCGIPIDTIGPCTPTLSVSNPCDNGEFTLNSDLINTLNWTRSDFVCEDSGDVEFYNIYFSSSLSEEAELIAILDATENEYEHLPEEGINGCYKISAVDSLGNEGIISNYVCVGNCPIYKLPNTFTPNNDGANDFFVPSENRFVSLIDFQVFNRWGNKIFTTTNPQILWDGRDLNGKDVDQGSYYYTCLVFDTDIEGLQNQVAQLSGYIQIIR